MTDRTDNEACVVCGMTDNVNRTFEGNRGITCIDCPRCGPYKYTRLAFQPIPENRDRMHLLSGAIRFYKERALECFMVDSHLLQTIEGFDETVLPLVPRNIPEKINRVLEYIRWHTEHPGANVDVKPAIDYPIAFCRNMDELHYYIDHIHSDGLVDGTVVMGPVWHLALTPAGWTYLDNLDRVNDESTQGFVAMWFDNSVNSMFREAIEPAGKAAGYEMIRIDLQEFNDKICDQIIAEIKRSKFVVADVTGQRQGVYFEAGYALGLGIPVIWTCRSDEIDKCHFDTRQYKHIAWETPDELKEKLKNRILATIGAAKR